jgi:hypothetical protein
LGQLALAVEGSSVLNADGSFGFQVANYDPSRVLVLDPVLDFSTYAGGSGTDDGYGIATDAAGNSYVTGVTNSSNFPTLNPYQSSYGGNGDVFVSKYSPSGVLLYSTYVGGSQLDQANAIVVDMAGNAYVTGLTSSSAFPTKNAFQAGGYGGNTDAVVQEIFRTFLGGPQVEPFLLPWVCSALSLAWSFGQSSTEPLSFPPGTESEASGGSRGAAMSPPGRCTDAANSLAARMLRSSFPLHAPSA